LGGRAQDRNQGRAGALIDRQHRRPVTVQLRVLLLPAEMVMGEAVKLTMAGVAAGASPRPPPASSAASGNGPGVTGTSALSSAGASTTGPHLRLPFQQSRRCRPSPQRQPGEPRTRTSRTCLTTCMFGHRSAGPGTHTPLWRRQRTWRPNSRRHSRRAMRGETREDDPRSSAHVGMVAPFQLCRNGRGHGREL